MMEGRWKGTVVLCYGKEGRRLHAGCCSQPDLPGVITGGRIEEGSLVGEGGKEEGGACVPGRTVACASVLLFLLYRRRSLAHSPLPACSCIHHHYLPRRKEGGRFLPFSLSHSVVLILEEYHAYSACRLLFTLPLQEEPHYHSFICFLALGGRLPLPTRFT